MLHRRNYLSSVGLFSFSFLGSDASTFLEPTAKSPEDAVEAYVEAGITGDSVQLRETIHSENPTNLSNRNIDELKAVDDPGTGWMYGWADADEYEVELLEYDVDLSEVYDIPKVKYWYENRADLMERLDGETGALVETTFTKTVDGDPVENSITYLAITDNGEWTVSFKYEDLEIPDGPVKTNTYPLIDEIELHPDSDLSVNERAGSAKIHVADYSDMDAELEEIRVYSTSLETYSRAIAGGTTIVKSFTSSFDNEGDRLVITAVIDGDEVVIQRETFAPGDPKP